MLGMYLFEFIIILLWQTHDSPNKSSRNAYRALSAQILIWQVPRKQAFHLKMIKRLAL